MKIGEAYFLFFVQKIYQESCGSPMKSLTNNDISINKIFPNSHHYLQ